MAGRERREKEREEVLTKESESEEGGKTDGEVLLPEVSADCPVWRTVRYGTVQYGTVQHSIVLLSSQLFMFILDSSSHLRCLLEDYIRYKTAQAHYIYTPEYSGIHSATSVVTIIHLDRNVGSLTKALLQPT